MDRCPTIGAIEIQMGNLAKSQLLLRQIAA